MQAALLAAEGITVDEKIRIINVAAHLRSVGDLPHGVCQQQRPASAPRCAVGESAAEQPTLANLCFSCS
jgi:hypothetical protein